MSRLKPGKRARLPDRAFAYVDARGRRRLPIHDKAHVRNALARFNQVHLRGHDSWELSSFTRRGSRGTSLGTRGPRVLH